MDLDQMSRRGTYGYITIRRKSLLIKSVLCGALFAILLLIGYLIFGTIKNLLMVPGMLTVIPLANFVASYAAVARFRSGTEEQYSMLANFYDNDMLMADLLIVDGDGARYFCEFAVIYRGGMVAYSSDIRWPNYKLEIHINELFKKRGIPMNLKVYKDFDEFLKRIDGIEPAVEDDLRRIELARETVFNTCM